MPQINLHFIHLNIPPIFSLLLLSSFFLLVTIVTSFIRPVPQSPLFIFFSTIFFLFSMDNFIFPNSCLCCCISSLPSPLHKLQDRFCETKHWRLSSHINRSAQTLCTDTIESYHITCNKLPQIPSHQKTKLRMKFFIVLAVIASATAVPYAGVVNTGASAVSRSDDVSWILNRSRNEFTLSTIIIIT